MNKQKFYRAFMLVFGILLFRTVSAVDLPELGDPSSQAITPWQEKEIGTHIVQKLYQSGQVELDPWLTDYVTTLGKRLVLPLQNTSTQHFQFFVMSDNTLNAFALPGGYIGVNTGLIREMRTEAELAAVIAHEIAHVEQHHIARMYENASRLNLPTVAAALAAMALASQNKEAGTGALAAAFAGGKQMQLNFSRQNEREADQVGLQILASAGFDPRAMPLVFERMEQYYRTMGSSMPEYLMTHPVNPARISDSRNRAEQYPESTQPSSTAFFLAQARLDYLAALNPRTFLENTEKKLQKKSTVTLQDNYLLALALYAAGQLDAASALCKQLIEAHPEQLQLINLLAEIEQSNGTPGLAISHLEHTLQLYPFHRPTLFNLVKIDMDHGKAADGAKRLESYLRSQKNDILAYRLLAESYRKAKDPLRVHEAEAEYLLQLGEPEAALNQLNIAYQKAAKNSVDSKRIRAHIDKVNIALHESL